jgi:hypothetical protein
MCAYLFVFRLEQFELMQEGRPICLSLDVYRSFKSDGIIGHTLP